MNNSSQTLTNDTVWEGQIALSELEVYNNWIAEQIKPYLGDKILEIGIGTGNCTRHLINDTKQYWGIDSNKAHIDFVKKRFNGFSGFNAVYARIDALQTEFPTEKFDTILSINCFEHIHDDKISFKNINTLLKETGRLVLYVPAMKCLYNSLDKKAAHYRRYSKKELLSKLNASGFMIEKIHYSNFMGAILWFFSGLINYKNRQADHIADPKPFLNMYNLVKAFIPLVKLQIKLEKIIKPPFGASLVCIAVKTQNQSKESEKYSWVTKIAENKGFYDVLTEETYNSIIEKTVKKFSIKKDAKILDAGCGTGAFSLRFKSHGYNPYGVDISHKNMSIANEYLLSYREKIPFITADIENLPFKDESFDAVFCGFVIHHFWKTDTLGKELLRILKPGGYVFCVEPNGLSPHMLLVIHPFSPVRYDKFSINERPMVKNDFKKMFFPAEVTINAEYISTDLKTKQKNGLKGFLYKRGGFLMHNIGNPFRRSLAFLLFNICHLIQNFLPYRCRCNHILAIARKNI